MGRGDLGDVIVLDGEVAVEPGVAGAVEDTGVGEEGLIGGHFYTLDRFSA